MNSKNILVVGGAGYIGSHTCKLIANNGYAPIVYDNLSYGHEYAIKFGEFVKGDLHDSRLLVETMKKYNPIAVIHFAAFIQVGESVINPSIYYNNNVVGTINLLDCMNKQNIKNIVFSSTAAVYGMPNVDVIDEEQSKAPINPYGTSKFMIEQIMDDYDKAYGLKSVRLRYFNASGASKDCDIGEDHSPETHLIPAILRAGINNSSFSLMGTDYNTPDGTCVRDFIHVDDLAQAHLKAVEYLINGGKTDYFNLGTGNGYSCKEVLQTVEQIINKTIRVKVVERRAGDPDKLVASNRKAQDILDFKLVNSDLKNIIQTAYNWHLKKQNL